MNSGGYPRCFYKRVRTRMKAKELTFALALERGCSVGISGIVADARLCCHRGGGREIVKKFDSQGGDMNSGGYPRCFYKRVRTRMKAKELTFALALKREPRARKTLKMRGLSCVLVASAGKSAQNDERKGD